MRDAIASKSFEKRCHSIFITFQSLTKCTTNQKLRSISLPIVCGSQIQRIEFVITCVQCNKKKTQSLLMRSHEISCAEVWNRSAFFCKRQRKRKTYLFLLRSIETIDFYCDSVRTILLPFLRCDWKNPLVVFTIRFSNVVLPNLDQFLSSFDGKVHRFIILWLIVFTVPFIWVWPCDWSHSSSI